MFATSLTAVIAPMVSRSLLRIVDRKGNKMKRENHFVVVGNTPLALNTCRELARRGCPVTRILREAPELLTDDGVLIVEVGESERALVELLPEVPFNWVEFAVGQMGVFVLDRNELVEHADAIRAAAQR